MQRSKSTPKNNKQVAEYFLAKENNKFRFPSNYLAWTSRNMFSFISRQLLDLYRPSSLIKITRRPTRNSKILMITARRNFSLLSVNVCYGTKEREPVAINHFSLNLVDDPSTRLTFPFKTSFILIVIDEGGPLAVKPSYIPPSNLDKMFHCSCRKAFMIFQRRRCKISRLRATRIAFRFLTRKSSLSGHYLGSTPFIIEWNKNINPN